MKSNMIYDPSWRHIEVSSLYFYNDILLGNVGKLLLIEVGRCHALFHIMNLSILNEDSYILAMNEIGIMRVGF